MLFLFGIPPSPADGQIQRHRMPFARPAARQPLALPIPSHRHGAECAIWRLVRPKCKTRYRARLRDLAAPSARVLPRFTPETGGRRTIPEEGRRECRDARRTRGLVRQCAKEMRTRAYRFSGGIRHSLRNGLTAYATLSSATNSSCHRRRRIEAAPRPGRVRIRHRRLGTSNGCRDHMVLPYAQTPFVLRARCRSRGSTRPATAMARRRSRVHRILFHVRDDARPPLLPEQDSRR